MDEEKPKTGRCEFDVKRQLWIVYNGKEWVEVDLKKHRCNFNNESHGRSNKKYYDEDLRFNFST